MRLTPRRRAVIALVVSSPVIALLVVWMLRLGFDVLLRVHGSYDNSCGSGLTDLATRFAGCATQFGAVLAIVEMVGLFAVLLAICYGLARWITWPIRAMSDTVEQLGPTSLGMRLAPTGPRDETRRLAESIDAMLDRLTEGYEAQRRFAANASHELRTPLATQRALIEVSLTAALTPDQLELVSRQLLATNARNEALIEGLLVLSETERGLMASTPQRVDLLTAAVVETYRPAAAERRIAIDVQLEAATVAGEQPLLERLITNLIQNAIKYNHDGGWVRVRVAADSRLTVANSGPRVAAETVDSLFEPFRRAQGERLDHGGGVGLGLTIARSVVAAHGGRIEALAAPDGGLVIDVRLPPSR